MVDLTEICGDDAQIISLQKKRAKAQERLDKVLEKAKPLQMDVAMYNDLIAIILKRHGTSTPENPS